jgi:hypothetical protein
MPLGNLRKPGEAKVEWAHQCMVYVTDINLLVDNIHDVDWIGLAKDRNRWRALVNSVLNLRVP